jgi:para-nitrobenzyl esterase
VVDGVVLPRQPLEAMRDGSAANVPVLVGTTADEWNLFHVMRRQPDGMDDATLERRVAHVLPPDRARDAIEAYRGARPDATNDDIFCAIGTDLVFRIPAVRLAEAQSAHQSATRMYLFNYKSTAFGGGLGACHAIDIPFVFDNVDRRGVDLLVGEIDDSTRALSTATSTAWLAMARSGSPEHDGLPPWPEYSATHRTVMELSRTSRLLDDPGGAERAFWDSLV